MRDAYDFPFRLFLLFFLLVLARVCECPPVPGSGPYLWAPPRPEARVGYRVSALGGRAGNQGPERLSDPPRVTPIDGKTGVSGVF